MLHVLVAVAVVAYFVYSTDDHPKLKEVKRLYVLLMAKLIELGEFPMLHHVVPLVGFSKPMGPNVGYNTNKGEEIGLCLVGEVNQIFHVLLHELAHMTVDEYNHDEQFWNSFVRLRDIAVDAGLYTKISTKERFCGQHVND